MAPLHINVLFFLPIIYFFKFGLRDYQLIDCVYRYSQCEKLRNIMLNVKYNHDWSFLIIVGFNTHYNMVTLSAITEVLRNEGGVTGDTFVFENVQKYKCLPKCKN